MNTPEPQRSKLRNFLEHYWDILLGFIFGIVAIFFHKLGYEYIAVIASAIAIASFSVTVAEIAEILAERLEEPYATFVLTFSAVAVEILLLFMILLEASEAGMDTVKGGIISAVIVDMNVLLGLAVFIGGLSFRQQEHNEDTSGTYITILLVTVSALLVPSVLTYTSHSIEKIELASIIIGFVLIAFYVVIFIFQTKTHSHFFKATARSRILRYKRNQKLDESEEEEDSYIFEKFTNPMNLLGVFILILLIGILAEVFASDGVKVSNELGISAGLAGLIIAIISVSPEIFTAVKAARNDQIQRVINIAMGASTVSILLTVPILMLLSSIFIGVDLTLDFNSLQIGALILTVILAWKTTDDGETNYFEGMSHLMFFLCYAIIATLY